MKYLIIGAIIFFIYRYFNPPKRLNQGTPPISQEESNGEFVEYEELE